MNSGRYKVLAKLVTQATPFFRAPQSYRTPQFVVGSFRLESVLLTEGSVLRHLAVKAEFALEQVTKARRGKRGITLLFL